MTRDEWLLARRNYVCSTDVAAIAGLTKWHTALHVYYEKIGEGPPAPDEPSPEQELGLELEPYVAERYVRRFGTNLIGRREDDYELIPSPKYPALACSTDYIADDEESTVVEIKTTGFFDEAWGPDGGDQCPLEYILQVQHQLLVLGGKRARLAALSRVSGELRVYELPRHDALQDYVKVAATRFWAQVQARTPPEPDFAHPRTAELIERLYPARGGLGIELGHEAALLASLYDEHAGNLRKHEAQRKELRARLVAMMGCASTAHLPGGWQLRRSANRFWIKKPKGEPNGDDGAGEVQPGEGDDAA